MPSREDLAMGVATSAMHFAAKPHILPLFADYIRETVPETRGQPDAFIRAGLAQAHAILAPECTEPIEVI